ncbi:MAG: hypothetical protein EOP22_14995 [Hyphomicrobiales bacterium]|nr:MAG: hypothetical protein EOP22_14995 [Hyphomicrobiales bacterium]
MERLVIHPGLHKTGTTAVQQYLTAHAKMLRQRGISYLLLDRMRREATPLLRNTDRPEDARRYLEGFPAPVLILSDENIAGGQSEIAAGEFYPLLGSRLTSIAENLPGVEIDVVLTLRNPADLLPGLYSEYVRSQDFVSFASYAANLDLGSLSYWERFRWLRAMPKNVTMHLVPYERQFGAGVAGVAAAILRAAIGSSVGFDLRGFYEKKVRTSFTTEEIELAALIAQKSRPTVARRFLNNLDDTGARFGEHRFSPVPPAAAAAITERYREDLERFGLIAAAPA